MKRTYKYYLKLNKTQKQKLGLILSDCNFVYNLILGEFKARNKNKEKQPTEYQLIKSLVDIKKNNSKLKRTHSSVLQEVIKRVLKTWNDYKEGKKMGITKGYPRFKPIQRYNSFTYPQKIEKSGCGYSINNSSINQRTENRKLKLTLGNQNHHRVYLNLKLVMERNFEGDVKTLTISRKNNRHYVLFSCNNVKTKNLLLTNKNVGVDVNLNKQSYLTLSDGKKYKHPQHYRKTERELKVCQQSLSSKKKGSNNWKDTKLSFAKKWEKLINQSRWYFYQVANELVENYDGIAVEKLKIKNMVKNRCLSKSIQQARWGILFKVISDKEVFIFNKYYCDLWNKSLVEETGRRFVRVNPYNTTQQCSFCGELAKEKIKLSQREFDCWNCESKLDRDENSARNILYLGFDRNPPSIEENIY